MKIGITRERKTPPDYRVPLIPEHVLAIQQQFPSVEIAVESYPERCYPNEAYTSKNIAVVNDISDADVIVGVKEVPKEALIPNKTYFFFSHTIKKQPYNRDLLRTVLAKNIRLIDYECIKDQTNNRLIGFGRYAGIVGAYNGFIAWGNRYNRFQLKPANQCYNRAELDEELKKVSLPPIKILLTGKGRVANGAEEVLQTIGLKKVSTEAFLTQEFSEAVYAQVEYLEYTKHKETGDFNKKDFRENPEEFESDFGKFLPHTDFLITGHFWKEGSPEFFTREEMLTPSFKIKVIADISCDIAGPIPATIRASTIKDPIYGYDPKTGNEVDAYLENGITVMAVDNLPCEMPRDASEDFGNEFVKNIIPSLLNGDPDKILEKATIAENGKLTKYYAYLQDYVDGK